jgi:8-oxo-dGTP pyrophosphatase MutT (NUDIX family)
MSETPAALPLEVLHRGWNTFGIATLTLPDGSTVPRALEDHGQAACVLPYDPERRVALLDGGDPEATAIREAMEEAGVRLERLERVAHAYSMPSVSSERLWLYLAPYAEAHKVGPGGGLHGEGEQVLPLEVPLATLAEAARSGRLPDLKTLVLVQALMLRRPELFAA